LLVNHVRCRAGFHGPHDRIAKHQHLAKINLKVRPMKQSSISLLVGLLCWVAPAAAPAATNVDGIPPQSGTPQTSTSSQPPQETAFLPSVFLAQPPLFLAPPQLGIYVAVKCPHDLYYHRDRYYLWWNNRWFAAPSYNGPWRVLADTQLPGPLRTNDISAIRKFRDAEYRRYLRYEQRQSTAVLRN
jgi:hypothetical protein